MPDPIAIATELADDVLFPAAIGTDSSDLVPLDNLDALAAAGLYGLFAPTEVGGFDADFPTICDTVELVASGCLSTALVWVQHFGLLGSLLDEAPAPLREEWLADAAAGRRRGGIAWAAFRAGPSPLGATAAADGWVLDGFEPFVSGWGRIDSLDVAARGPDGTVVHVAIDAAEVDGLRVTRHELAAVDASGTVRVDFDGYFVPESRVLKVATYAPAVGGSTSRFNGFLALGVARRCCRLLALPFFDDELKLRRSDLHGAADEEVGAARARASEFALRAAGALVVRDGSSAVLADQHAQRLLREAMFALIFATPPSTKQALLGAFSRAGTEPSFSSAQSAAAPPM